MSQPALQGAAALAVWGSVSSNEVDEAALNDWWTNEHLPERMSIPGFLRARRYMARDEAASASGTTITRYLTLYETEDVHTLTSREYMAAVSNPTPGTRLYLPRLPSMDRAACRVAYSERRAEFAHAAWKTTGALMGMMEFIVPESNTVADAVEAIKPAFTQWAQNERSLMSCSLLVEDAEASAPGNGSQAHLNGNLGSAAQREGGSRCMLLLEFAKTLQPLVQDMGVFLDQSPFFDGPKVMRFYQFVAGIGA
ncbi:hypothetical protein BDY17DRAFT_166859 [Neohortaea acidophila]|uniref:Uncharacterized protein n=1 Tax=Neohortaea acidophila TaxID=245834 RepID=A0A6A6PRT5_9PEZI|nr:uncharacterized protein BDY17DRAFT_166859 [Neohortaea acidophila]KAF2482809.1 hypothetical protein BDY17DRAFT_166859 [Neohortaea acidophila]